MLFPASFNWPPITYHWFTNHISRHYRYDCQDHKERINGPPIINLGTRNVVDQRKRKEDECIRQSLRTNPRPRMRATAPSSANTVTW